MPGERLYQTILLNAAYLCSLENNNVNIIATNACLRFTDLFERKNALQR